MGNSEENVLYQSVRNVVLKRRTWKVLGDVDKPVVIAGEAKKEFDECVRNAVIDSDWAPFHYDRRKDGIAQPWRFYFLDYEACQKIASNFHQWFDDVKPSNKLPSMLSACGSLVLVNWIPETGTEQTESKLAQINDEHLAATSAAVQNLLLLLTAHGLGTYWSSGGQFRTVKMFERLKISPDEKLLAAVFVEYPQAESDHEPRRVPGKHRENRSAPDRWFREISLD